MGLTPAKCVAWECASTTTLFGESLLGKYIGDLFPALQGQLDNPCEVDVAYPNQPSKFLRAIPARTSGQEFEWIVRFAHRPANMAAAVLLAASLERSSLAQAVHKGPHQLLTALLLRLGQMRNGASSEEMKEIHLLVEEIASGLQSLSTELSPPSGSGSLAPRISSLAMLLQRHLGMRVSTSGAHGGSYPQSVEHAALCALQEVLLEAWQAKCLEATVSIHESKTQLRIIVEIEEFLGALIEDSVASPGFRAANGQVTCEMEARTTTITLQFPLASTGKAAPK